MIFGVPAYSRLSYNRPAGASPNFRPSMPATSYRSQNFHPWVQVLSTMQTTSASLPSMPRDMGPGPAPQYMAPPTPGSMAGFGDAGVPPGAANMMRAQRGPRLQPYRTARFGTFPRVAGSAADVKRLVTHAGAAITSVYPNPGLRRG